MNVDGSMALPAPPPNTDPIPNNPFYSPETYTIEGPYSPLIVGDNLFVSSAGIISAFGGGGGGGVSSINAGTGISVSGNTGNVTVGNTGVLSLTAGTNVVLSGSTGDVTISAADPGVTSLTAGAGIVLSGNTGNVTISASGGVDATPTLPGVIKGCTANTLYNTFLGNQAGLSNGGSASYNTYIGDGAGCANDGPYNTAVGAAALQDGTTGCWNVAVGIAALRTNSGKENTAVGSRAGFWFKGNGLTALGFAAANSVRHCTPPGIIAIGCYAANSAGSCNSIGNIITIGDRSQQINQLGACNIALGNCAMFCSLNSSNNISIGHCSMYAATCANGNLALGAFSLASLTTGSNNLAIGTNTGTNVCGGSGNLLIGHGVDVSAIGASNELVIGNSPGNYWLTGDSTKAIKPGAGIIDCNNSCGASGQVLISDGLNAVYWGNAGGGGSNPATPVVEGIVFGCTTLSGTSLGEGSGFSGPLNTAIGNCSLCTISTGGCNTGLGALSGCNLTQGSYNTLLGFFSGCNITQGSRNVIIGSQVTAADPLGSNQLAIGPDATNRWITGDSTFAIRPGAGIIDCAGSCGTANQVLLSTGANSVCWGTVCGSSVPATPTVEGSVLGCTDVTNANTTLGNASGVGLTTGTGNLFLGSYAGSLVTTGCKNVAIGANVDVSSPTGSCQLAIGFDANQYWLQGCSDLAVKFGGGIIDCAGVCGTAGQVLTSNGSNGICWATPDVPVSATPEIEGIVFACTTASNLTAFLGKDAGKGSIGTSNTFLGGCAGCGGVSGSNNTALGALSGATLTNGCLNVMIGALSGVTLTTGSRNVLIGPLVRPPSANVNCYLAIGYSNDQFWLTGNSTKAIKPGAGIIDCSDNCGSAGQVLMSTGTNGVCWGTISPGSTPAATPTVEGTLFGCTNSTGLNSFLGYLAGSALNTGECNVFLGSCAGSTVSTGCLNIAIGHNVDVASPTGSCQLAIGYNNQCWLQGFPNLSVKFGGGIIDCAGLCGNAGQALLSDGTNGVCWGSVSGPISAATPQVEGILYGCSTGEGAALDGCSITSVGRFAGKCVSAGRALTLIGTEAGCNLVSGCYNTLIGDCAGHFLSSGNFNVAIGHCAELPPVSNCQLVIAYDKCCYWLTGNENKAIKPGGAIIDCNDVCGTAGQALLSDGANGVYWGTISTGGIPVATPTVEGVLFGCTNSTCLNASLGYSAGTLLSTGECNVFLGACSGSTVTSGCQNVAIGPNVSVTSPTGSCQLAIGYGNQYWLQGCPDLAIRFGGGIIDCAGFCGTAGQALLSDGANGVCWGSVSGGAVPATPTFEGNVYGCTHDVNNSVVLGQNSVTLSASTEKSTLIGANAGCAITSCEVVALGFESGINAGNWSVSIGTCSNGSNGEANTYVGHRSGLAPGCRNVGIGCGVLLNFTSSNSNVVSGYHALLGQGPGAQDAFGNVALGSCVMISARSAIENTAVGYNAGFNFVAGNTNTLIGTDAGGSFTCGCRNVALGPVNLPNGNCQLAIGFSSTENWLTGYSTKAIKPGAGIVDCTDSCGGAGQVLMSDGANAVCWGSIGSSTPATPSSEGIVFGCTNDVFCNIIFGQNTVIPSANVFCNILIGEDAGCGMTCAESNVIIGTCSGQLLKIANTVVGSNSAQIDQGCWNTYLGELVALNVTCGFSNLAAGLFSLRNFPQPKFNIALGTYALNGQTNCSTVAECTIALGTSALACAVCSLGNVAIGQGAGCNLNCGAYNTFIGVRSVYQGGFINGCRNVAIGADVEMTSGDCQLAIGFSSTENWLTGDSTKAIRPGAGIIDCAGSTGTAGQVLMSNGSNAICWGTASGGGTTSPATSLVEGIVYGCTNDNIGNVTLGRDSGIVFDPLSIENTYIGCRAGCGQSAGGAKNVAIGFEAGSVTSGPQAGCFNVAIGHRAGADYAGQFNTYVGYSTGQSAGSCNVAVGTCILSSGVSTSSFNTALGYNTLKGDPINSVVASGNVAIGCFVLGNYICACSNIAIGDGAGCDLTCGDGNTFIGPGAGGTQIQGDRNVAIGYQANFPTNCCTGCQLAIGFSGSDYWLTGCSDKSIKPGAGIIDCTDSLGVSGQSLKSTGNNGVEWCVVFDQRATLLTPGALTGEESATSLILGSDLYKLVGCTVGRTDSTIIGQSILFNADNLVCIHGNTLIGTDVFLTSNLLNTCLNTMVGNCSGWGAQDGIESVSALGFRSAELGWGSQSVAIGTEAGRYLGDLSVSIGSKSLWSEKTKPPTGLSGFNTAVGACAGYSLGTGQFNTLLGYCAGHSASAGSYNVLLGHEVQQAFGDVDCQLAIGFSSTDNWIVGDSTKAIKPGAGIIDCAGSCGTNGQVLMSNGANALCWGTIVIPPPTIPDATPSTAGIILGCSTSTTTSLGSGSGAAGTSNVAIGASTLSAVGGSGTGNTALGHRAGLNFSSGSNNVFLGNQAGSALTSVSCNVLIGPGALPAQSGCPAQLAIAYCSGCNWLTGDITKAIRPGAGIVDCAGSCGAVGEVLSSTGTNAVVWATPSVPVSNYGSFYSSVDQALSCTASTFVTWNCLGPSNNVQLVSTGSCWIRALCSGIYLVESRLQGCVILAAGAALSSWFTLSTSGVVTDSATTGTMSNTASGTHAGGVLINSQIIPLSANQCIAVGVISNVNSTSDCLAATTINNAPAGVGLVPSARINITSL